MVRMASQEPRDQKDLRYNTELLAPTNCEVLKIDLQGEVGDNGLRGEDGAPGKFVSHFSLCAEA